MIGALRSFVGVTKECELLEVCGRRRLKVEDKWMRFILYILLHSEDNQKIPQIFGHALVVKKEAHSKAVLLKICSVTPSGH